MPLEAVSLPSLENSQYIVHSASLSIYALEEHLGEHQQHPTSNSEQQPPSKKSNPMPPQCCQFVELINKLRRVLSKDPESDADVLASMKLALATLKGQDESIAIEPGVYRGKQTVTDFSQSWQNIGIATMTMIS